MYSKSQNARIFNLIEYLCEHEWMDDAQESVQ